MEPVPSDILGYCRELRRRMTEAEKLLWELLRNRRLGGFKFRRQKALGRYIVDFYCVERRLAIELDGGGHAEAAQQRHDTVRSAVLNANGVEVLRFWNNEVLGQTEDVLAQIWRVLHQDHPHPVPLPRSAGEGT